MNLPVLFHKGKGGAIFSWEVYTKGSTIFTSYGQRDGKKQISEKVAVAKNLGKKNETSPIEQAESEAHSMWVYKVERKYSETPSEAQEELFLPMLAHDFHKRPDKKISYPVTVQKKFEGVRCISYWQDDEVLLMSRSGKPYDVPHVAAEVAKYLPKGDILDGELYHHGTSNQTITSWVKKDRPESKKLIYVVYDYPIKNGVEDAPWDIRQLWVDGLSYAISSVIKCTSGLLAYNKEDVLAAEQKFVSEGYEGAIVRQSAGLYLWGYRSYDLLKCKSFEDAEFKVLSCTDGKGKFEGKAIWTCQNDITNGTFDVVCEGTMEERAEQFVNSKKYIGRLLTVKFKGRTNDNLPYHLTGKGFRDERDL